MPEGDTVHRIAFTLGRALARQRIERLHLRDTGPVTELEGKLVEAVEARGKHLLIHIEGGWTARVHLGMNGRWRRLQGGRRPPGSATLLIEAGGRAYACLRGHGAELVRSSWLRSHALLVRLGPDLLAQPPRLDEAVARASLPGHGGREIGDVLLDQRVASGIGNAYKSEVLFLCRIHPRQATGTLDGASLRALFQEAARLMRGNLRTTSRTTVPLRRRPRPSSPRLWVYGRDGKPCLECRTSIRRIVQGHMARSTYFCPECQPFRRQGQPHVRTGGRDGLP